MNALVVDDEEDIGLMVTRFLRKEGINTDYADRVESARQKLDENEYELVLLDLNLPDGTGFDLMPDINDKEKEISVIVISAHDGIYEQQKVSEFGIHKFIKKPFSKTEVMEAINSLFQ